MASADELQERKDTDAGDNEGRQDRMQQAIDARNHANDYQNDSEQANEEADAAEERIDNPDNA